MDSTRWQKVQTVFHEAADLPPAQQAAFLKNACNCDAELLADVQGLLAEDARGTSFLDSDAAHVAQQILDDSPPPHHSFKDIGPYRIRKTLGEGGMGVVYLAEREDLGNLVAIKILRDAWLSPARRERFAIEQRTLAQLNHPSVARLYDAATSPDGTPFFVMEYVEGIPLTDYCEKHKLTIEQRLRLFRAVCEAVQYAHQHAVIHRDLKPSNILVKEDGTIRLLDFGIAKHLDNLAGEAERTLTGLRFMTPAYAAPERMRGEQVGIHTDVYSLGVILYQLLTRSLPFDLSNLTPAQAELVVAEQPPEKPSVVAKNTGILAGNALWSDLEVLCLTAMHRDLQRRYRSVEALVRDVDHYLGRQPLEARADTARYRFRKFVARNQRPVIAASAMLAILIAMLVFYTVRLTKARNDAIAEAARTERVSRFMRDLFQGGDESTGPAENLKVTTLLERGVQEAGALDQDAEVQADFYETLGGIYEQLGNYDQADSLLTKALKKRQARFGPDNATVAESLIALGGLRELQAQYDEAEKLVRQGRDMAIRHLPPEHPDVAKASETLGDILDNRGQYDQAIPLLEEAIRLQSAPSGVPADLAVSLTELANVHFYAGRYDLSNDLNLRALQIDRKLYGDKNPNVAQDLINLGEVQFQWGHYADAERYDRRALAIMKNWYGMNNPETADANTVLSKVLAMENKLDEASGLLQQSLAIQEKIYSSKHPRVAYTLIEMARVARERGNLDEAETELARAVDIDRSVYGYEDQHTAATLANLGGVCASRQQYGRAESLFREALRIDEKTLPAGHLNIANTKIRLGTVLARQHRFAEAEKESLDGYQLLTKQSKPAPDVAEIALNNLIEASDALHQTQQATQYRAELTRLEKKLPAPVAAKR